MSLITQEMLKTLQPNQSISGVILVANYGIQLTKTNKEYVAGNLQAGIQIPFKSWGSSSAFAKFKGEDYLNMPAFITATVDNYGGTLSLIVESVQAVDGYTADQFYPVKYNTEAYWDALIKNVSSKVSEKCMSLCNKILFENTELAEKFKKEFAASSHHDNCKSGLLAHTYKVVAGVSNMIVQYPDLCKRDGAFNQDFADLLVIGALLHDIGKVDEMNFGVYQDVAIVTHRYLALEYIQPLKAEIIEAYNDMWYYNLVSIILQHHDEYGEPCKTLASYLVHLVDEYDAMVTLLAQSVESAEATGGRFKVDGRYLTI